MSPRLSSRLDGVAESATLKMSAAARELSAKGVKVVNLAAGEPDFPVPAAAKDAAIAAIRGDFSKYTPVPGILELRRAISRKLEKDNGLAYSPEEIIVTSGAKQAIFNFLLATLSPGDEVIIPAPYWVSYPDMVRLAGGKPVIVPTAAASGFKMGPSQLKGALSPRTRAVILNSPSNPTGAVYSGRELQELASVLEGTDAWVVSDEIYEKIIYGDAPHFASFAALSQDAFRRTLTVNGFSKAYAMTGWRLGYAAGPKPLIQAMSLLQGQSTSGANSVAQKAALAALELPESVFEPMVEAFERRRDRMAEIFSRSANFSFTKPAGAFYLFLNIESVLGRRYNEEVMAGSDDVAFYLLNQAHVGTVAGIGFGAEGYLRLSFAVSDAEVDAGSRALVAAVDTIAGNASR